MIDRPTIAKIMDATKIEEVVSEFVTLKKRGHMDRVAVLRCTFFEERGIALRLIPEGTVRAHDDIRRVHALDQDGAQEILRRDAHGLPVHRIGKDIVEAEIAKAS